MVAYDNMFLTLPKFEWGCFNWLKYDLGCCNLPEYLYYTLVCKSEWNYSHLPSWF